MRVRRGGPHDRRLDRSSRDLGPFHEIAGTTVVFRIVRNLSDLLTLGAHHDDPRWRRSCATYAIAATAGDLGVLAAVRRARDPSTRARLGTGYLVATATAYLAFARTAPPLTLWRTGDDLIFSAGLVSPTMLLAETSGLGTSLVATAFGLPFFVASAWLNGEPLLLTSEHRRRLMLEAGWAAGLSIAGDVIGRAAKSAVARAESEQTEASTLAASAAFSMAHREQESRLRTTASDRLQHGVARLRRAIDELGAVGFPLARLLDRIDVNAPALLTDDPTVAPLRAVLEAWSVWSSSTGCLIDVATTSDPPLDPFEEELVALIVDIGLANVARHAPGCRADVRLEADACTVRLEVVDNGPGPSRPGAGSDPLHSLAVTAALLESRGGWLRLLRGDAGGAVLRAEMPR